MNNFIEKGEVPFVRMLIPLIIGIVGGLYCVPKVTLFNTLFVILISLFLIFVFAVILYQKLQLYRYKWLIGAGVFTFIGLAGYLLTIIKSEKLDSLHFSKTRQEFLLTVIQSEPKLSGDIIRFETKVQQRIQGERIEASSGKLLIALKLKDQPASTYRYGDLVLIPAYYNEVEPPFNPYEFDFKKYLAHKAVYHQTFINDHQIKILKRHQGNVFIDYALSLRQHLIARFNHYIHNKDAAAVASTLILGYVADLSQEVLSAYRSTGTTHVLSVSGMHVGIVFIFLAFLLKRFDKKPVLKVIKTIFILLCIWAYTGITGFSAAACRAALMISFVIIGKALNRKQNTYNLIAISAVFLLIYNPFFLVDVGFQLSYLAVLGLIYLYPKLYHAVYCKNYIIDKIWAYTALSIAAQLATSPISLYYFHQFPNSFLISNLFIVLPVSLMMYTGLVFIVLPFDYLAKTLGWLLEKLIANTNNGLHYIEQLPYSVTKGIWINTLEYLFMYIILLGIVFFVTYRQRMFLYMALLSILLLTVSISWEKIEREQKNEVIFYSLRKNIAIGLIDAGKMSLISDLSPKDKTFLFSIQPFLDAETFGMSQKLNISNHSNYSNTFQDQHFIQFRNWRLLIWDQSFDHKKFNHILQVHTLLLSGNPKIQLKNLIKYVNFKLLLIDGTNKDYRISQWIQQAKELGIKYAVLKKSPAYRLTL